MSLSLLRRPLSLPSLQHALRRASSSSSSSSSSTGRTTRSTRAPRTTSKKLDEIKTDYPLTITTTPIRAAVRRRIILNSKSKNHSEITAASKQPPTETQPQPEPKPTSPQPEPKSTLPQSPPHHARHRHRVIRRDSRPSSLSQPQPQSKPPSSHSHPTPPPHPAHTVMMDRWQQEMQPRLPKHTASALLEHRYKRGTKHRMPQEVEEAVTKQLLSSPAEMIHNIFQENRNEHLFVATGGTTEFGLNSFLYHQNGKWLAVDLGALSHDQGPDNIMMLPDISLHEAVRDNLEALVLTHCHDDHIGAVSMLWKRLRCPIICTPFTAGVLQQRMDIDEFRSVDLRVVAPNETLQQGPFHFTMMHVTHSTPHSTAVIFHTPKGHIVHSGDWRFDDKPLVGAATDKIALQKYGDEGVIALIGESTNADSMGPEVRSETALRDRLRDLMVNDLKNKRIVVATCFSTHIERLYSLAEVGKIAKRQVYTLGRGMTNMIEAGSRSGLFLPKIIRGQPDIMSLLYAPNVQLSSAAKDLISRKKILAGDKYQPLPVPIKEWPDTPESQSTLSQYDKFLVLATGCQGEYYAALPRIARQQHLSLTLTSKDAVVFSSQAIPGNEEAVDNVVHHLKRNSIRVVENDSRGRGSGVITHLSGHAYRDDMEEMFRLLRPKILVAVHGESRQVGAHVALAKAAGIKSTVHPANGKIYRIRPEGVVDYLGQLNLTPTMYRSGLTTTAVSSAIKPFTGPLHYQSHSIQLVDEGAVAAGGSVSGGVNSGQRSEGGAVLSVASSSSPFSAEPTIVTPATTPDILSSSPSTASSSPTSTTTTTTTTTSPTTTTVPSNCFVTLEVSPDLQWHSQVVHTLNMRGTDLSATEHALIRQRLADAVTLVISQVSKEIRRQAEPFGEDSAAVVRRLPSWRREAYDMSLLSPRLCRAMEAALADIITPAPSVTLHLLPRV